MRYCAGTCDVRVPDDARFCEKHRLTARPVRVAISRTAYDEIRRALISGGTGGLIDDRVPEIEMDGVVLNPRDSEGGL